MSGGILQLVSHDGFVAAMMAACETVRVKAPSAIKEETEWMLTDDALVEETAWQCTVCMHDASWTPPAAAAAAAPDEAQL